MVEQSSHVNSAQLIGRDQNDIIVKTYDWTGYLTQFFKRIDSIKSKHHFAINNTRGEIHMKESFNSTSITTNLLKSTNRIIPSNLPPQIFPKGLSAERQWYLYQKIRPFCRIECRDKTCPLPEVPQPNTPCRTPCPTPRESPEPQTHQPHYQPSNPSRSLIPSISYPSITPMQPTISIPHQSRTLSEQRPSIFKTSIPKNQKKCSKCGQLGHNKRSCKQLH